MRILDRDWDTLLILTVPDMMYLTKLLIVWNPF